MRSFFSSLGWILFLLLMAAGLLFYNISYLPTVGKVNRFQQEIDMWTQRVAVLNDSLRRLRDESDSLFRVSFRFDELFVTAESLVLSPGGQVALKGIVPQLRGGRVEIIGHTDSSRPPAPWRNNWEYSAVAAAVVARELIARGVPVGAIVVGGVADTRPVATKATSDVQILNRRVEITVRGK